MVALAIDSVQPVEGRPVHGEAGGAVGRLADQDDRGADGAEDRDRGAGLLLVLREVRRRPDLHAAIARSEDVPGEHQHRDGRVPCPGDRRHGGEVVAR